MVFSRKYISRLKIDDRLLEQVVECSMVDLRELFDSWYAESNPKL